MNKYSLALAAFFVFTQTTLASSREIPGAKMTTFLFTAYSKCVTNNDVYIQKCLNKMPNKELSLKQICLNALDDFRDCSEEKTGHDCDHHDCDHTVDSMQRTAQKLNEYQLEYLIKFIMESKAGQKNIEQLRDVLEFIELSSQSLGNLAKAETEVVQA